MNPFDSALIDQESAAIQADREREESYTDPAVDEYWDGRLIGAMGGVLHCQSTTTDKLKGVCDKLAEILMNELGTVEIVVRVHPTDEI